MTHKLGICIPYRNRQEHLDRLVPHLSNYLNERGIEHKFYVGHQVDENLFNRGMMKNIAAKFAFDDGCDYIAWHDVDMLAYTKHMDTLPDYSYPEDNPIHIATKLSKYQYGLGYDQYFGGVVLFTKEQVERTNGYSNEYWDWGQEDDDLFWRCYFEDYTTGKVYKKINNKRVAKFNGENSSIKLVSNRDNNSCLHNDHTITIIFNAEQQDEKVPIWLVGDRNKRFIEYPLLRKDGSGTWGISFNNSRAVTATLFDKLNQFNYNWAKRFENLWTQVTLSYNSEEKNMYFYINDELISQMDGIKQNIPFPISGDLRSHVSIKPFLIGFCGQSNTHYKGKIADIKIYDKFFDDITKMEGNVENLVLDCDFTKEINGEINNVFFEDEDIEIIENIIPYRREGSFQCLQHEDEGFVNGGWAKGETTARNEKRFVTQMQQRKIDYKNDGYLQIMDKLTIQNIEENPYNCLNTTLINVTTRWTEIK
jgi:hypothetical protein